MKNRRIIALAFFALLGAGYVTAQTADEIISKYVQAIGGKDQLAKFTSVYTESTMEIMGMQGILKSTTLNGKGMKTEMDIMGNIITTCYTDKEGWSINPMTGNTAAESMPESQYKTGRDNIFIGGPFINYAESGYKAELLGTEAIGDVTAYKIKITLPDSSSIVYYFDPNTFYLIRSVQQADMQGQMVENVITFSDYQQVQGFSMPYSMEMSIAGGQLMITSKVTKVEINVPVDEAIFAKPI